MDDLNKGRLSVRHWSVAVLLLLVFFAQLAFSARQLSLTSDEPPNLGAGYTYLVTGETWHISSLGQPPLPFAWAALPVVLGNPDVPLQTLQNWHAFPLPPYLRALFPLLGPAEQLEVAGRVPMMLLGLVLASLVFRWAADLFGPRGGILALALMVFDPTMVAHTPLATGDLAVTLVGFAMFFISWRWAGAMAEGAREHFRGISRESRACLSWCRPDLWWDIAIGLLAGITMASKITGFVWLGLVLAIMAGVMVAKRAENGIGRPSRPLLRDLGIVVGRSVIIGAIAFLVLWGVYGFRIGPVRVGPYLLPLPAPDHWEGLIRQMERSSTRMLYLAGEAGVGGWWWYFPFAFLIKNPVPLLLIWGGAFVVSLRACRYSAALRSSLRASDFLFLLGFPVVYAALAICSDFNIGYRHLLPIHPFLYVFAAQWVSVGILKVRHTSRAWGKRALWLALWVWYIVGTVRVFPHYLAYFNEMVGGPSNGYRYLVDSNLDWGQSFKTLRKALDHLEIRPPLRVGYQWYAGPELYGIEYSRIPPLGDDFSVVFSPRFDPPPGTYVLGATLLQRGSGDLEQYEWFRHHTPIAQPGYALFVFRVDPHQPPATWIAQCTEPAAPLSEGVIAREFHTQPLRRVYFDCTKAWVYPEGGLASGWYALHERALEGGGASAGIAAQHLGQAHLAYDHRRYDGLAPAFRLYEYEPSMRTLGYTTTVWLASGGEGAVRAPLRLEGPLSFLGYRVVEVGAEGVTVETWWRVVGFEGWGMRPLSIMGHLVDGGGHPVAVADGLGVPLEMWEEGDVVVQYHEFALRPEHGGGVYWLETGVYWLDTLERQAVIGGGGMGSGLGDRILLQRVSVPGF